MICCNSVKINFTNTLVLPKQTLCRDVRLVMEPDLNFLGNTKKKKNVKVILL